MREHKSREINPLAMLGLIAILAGLVLVFYSLWQSQALEFSPSTEGTRASMAHGFKHTFLLLLEKLGLTLVIFGLLDLLLHLPSLNRHFLDRMRELILEHSYLERLRPETLADLASRAFAARLGIPYVDINKEGSFLRFFDSNIRDFLSHPYRENARAQIICFKVDEENFHVRDVVTYSCRMVGKTIQKVVRWTNDPSEVADVRRVSISVQIPGGAKEEIANQSKFRFKYAGDEVLYETPLNNREPVAHVLEESLAKYSECDGLEITIEGEYAIKKHSFQYWQMSHLTKGMDLTLSFPDYLEAQVAVFVQNEERFPPTRSNGYYRFSYPQWVMPDLGICWRFIERQTSVPSTSLKRTPGGAA